MAKYTKPLWKPLLSPRGYGIEYKIMCKLGRHSALQIYFVVVLVATCFFPTASIILTATRSGIRE